MLKADDHKRAYQLALKYLARREYSAQELQQKLQQKDFDKNVITDVITELIDKKLLSDERFAEAYIQMRWRRGYGPLRIQLELQQRGISADTITSVLAAYKAQLRQQAEQVRRKKFGAALPTTMQERAQQMRFLQYRGFSSEQIKMVFSHDDEC